MTMKYQIVISLYCFKCVGISLMYEFRAAAATGGMTCVYNNIDARSEKELIFSTSTLQNKVR